MDENGNLYSLLEEITDHQKGGHIIICNDMYITGKNVNRHICWTTKGRKFIVKRKDGDTSCNSLKDIKEGDPAIAAGYAVVNKTNTEPTVTWWTLDTLIRRDCTIYKVKSRYWRHTHNFGIHITKTVD